MRRNKTSRGWVENSLGNITVRPSRVTESITRWQGVLPPAMAQLCTSALCCQGKREESGSAWDECVCQQRSALNQSLSTICRRRTLSLEPQSKGSAWPRDELGRCHFGWFSSIELGYIQSYRNSNIFFPLVSELRLVYHSSKVWCQEENSWPEIVENSCAAFKFLWKIWYFWIKVLIL